MKKKIYIRNFAALLGLWLVLMTAFSWFMLDSSRGELREQAQSWHGNSCAGLQDMFLSILTKPGDTQIDTDFVEKEGRPPLSQKVGSFPTARPPRCPAQWRCMTTLSGASLRPPSVRWGNISAAQ